MVGQVIRKKLYDAATQGDAATFQQLLQEDPYLLDVVSFPYSRNLLHIATMRRQISIVEEVLKINPQLAWSLDSNKSSPLHIAATQGQVEIASKLLAVAPEMCWLRDCHGMNPAHIAAVNGHVEILEEIIRHDPLPAREKVDYRQTALHLCVKHGQLRILQVLVNNLGELVHEVDDDGETILHLAVRYKQVEIVRYLVENSRAGFMYSTNSKGKTAMQISLESLGDTTDSEMTKILHKASTIKSGFGSLRRGNDMALVFLILVAGMTFQAAISPPGGVWQDDSSTHQAGTAIMGSIDPESYKEFLTANTSAFTWSLFTIMVLALASPTLSDISVTITIWMGFFFSLISFFHGFEICTLVLTPDTEHEYFLNSQVLFAITAAVANLFHMLYRDPGMIWAKSEFVAGLPMVVTKVSSFIDKYVAFWRESPN